MALAATGAASVVYSHPLGTDVTFYARCCWTCTVICFQAALSPQQPHLSSCSVYTPHFSTFSATVGKAAARRNERLEHLRRRRTAARPAVTSAPVASFSARVLPNTEQHAAAAVIHSANCTTGHLRDSNKKESDCETPSGGCGHKRTVFSVLVRCLSRSSKAACPIFSPSSVSVSAVPQNTAVGVAFLPLTTTIPTSSWSTSADIPASRQVAPCLSTSVAVAGEAGAASSSSAASTATAFSALHASPFFSSAAKRLLQKKATAPFSARKQLLQGLCTAVSAVSYRPSTSQPSACRALISSLPELPMHALPAAALRLLREGVLDASVWKILSQRIVEGSEELQVQQAAGLLRAYALRQLQDFNVFSHLTARLIRLLQQCPPTTAPAKKGNNNYFEKEDRNDFISARDITNIIVASGKLLYLDRELHALLVAEMPRVLPDMRPKDLVNIAHAYAKLRLVDEKFFSLVAKTLPPYLYDLTPIGLVNIVTSFAKVGVYDAKLFDAVAAEAGRRMQEFGGTELLNLLMGLSKIEAALEEKMKRRDGEFLAMILKALRRRMGPFGFVQLLHVLESLILLNYFDSLFIHKKLLPALLARRPGPLPHHSAAAAGPAAAAAAATRAEAALTLYLRLLCCLQQLPALSQTALQLLQEVVEQLPALFLPEDLGRVAVVIYLLHKLQCYDYDSFSKAEALLLADRARTLRQLRFQNILQLQEAFTAFGDDSHWGELLHFFEYLVRETATLLEQQQLQQHRLEQQQRDGLAAGERPLHIRTPHQSVQSLSETVDTVTLVDKTLSQCSTHQLPEQKAPPKKFAEEYDKIQSCLKPSPSAFYNTEEEQTLIGSETQANREEEITYLQLTPSDSTSCENKLLQPNSLEGRIAARTKCSTSNEREHGSSVCASKWKEERSRGSRAVAPTVQIHQYDATQGYKSHVVALDKHMKGKLKKSVDH